MRSGDEQTCMVWPPVLRGWSWGDAVAILALAALLYLGVRLAVGAPAGMQGPDISLAPGMLPWYAALSMGRMAGAYGSRWPSRS